MVNEHRRQGIIVTRFSPRPNQDDCTSNERQQERCRTYCARNDIEPLYYYEDRGESGGKESRPGLDTAIEALKPGMVLVVDRHDRLARDMHVSLAIRLRVAMAGCEIRYADGTPAEDTPVGEFMVNILASVAQFQRSQIRGWCKAASKKRRKEKKRFGTIPIGWRVDEADSSGISLVRDKREREAILTTCRFWEQGVSSEAIARDLTSDNGLCRGKPWNASTVRKIAKNHSYWAAPIHGDITKEPTHP